MSCWHSNINHVKIVDIFLVSIYLHFCRMKDKGKEIIPWFQTLVALVLFTSISIVLILKLIIGDSLNKAMLPQLTFVLAFILVSAVFFFSIKYYFFDTGKYLTLSQQYMDTNTSKQRMYYKVFSIALLLILPVSLGFLVWLNAKS